MNIIFLDIDGVLNSSRTDIVLGEEKKVSNLDPIGLGLVRDLCHECDAVICLISDWRLYWDIHKLAEELELPIIFETDNYGEEGFRGDEIEDVLSSGVGDKYVIIDDIDQILESQRKNFVKVDDSEGFIYRDYLKAIDIFGMELTKENKEGELHG